MDRVFKDREHEEKKVDLGKFKQEFESISKAKTVRKIRLRMRIVCGGCGGVDHYDVERTVDGDSAYNDGDYIEYNQLRPGDKVIFTDGSHREIK